MSVKTDENSPSGGIVEVPILSGLVDQRHQLSKDVAAEPCLIIRPNCNIRSWYLPITVGQPL